MTTSPNTNEQDDVASTAFIGRIYRLSSPSFDKVYVGSTRKTLGARLGSHKCSMRRWERGKYNYVTSFALVGSADVTIDLIEEDEYEDVQQMRDRERYWIERLPSVNRNLPGRSKAESKRISNATRIPCAVCGKSVQRHNIKEHQRAHSCRSSAFIRPSIFSNP